MIDAATGQPLIAAPAQPQMYQMADGGIYQVQQATPIQLIGGGQTLQVGGAGTALQITPQGAITLAPHVGQMHSINITPNALHIMQNAMVPGPSLRQNIQQQQFTEQSSPMRRKSKHDLSPEINSKSLSALKDRKDEIIMELGSIVGQQAAHTISEMALQHATTNYKLNLDPPDVPTPSRRPSGQDNALNGPASSTYGMWTTKPLVTMNNIREEMRNSEPISQTIEEDDVKPLPDGICVSRFGPISRARTGSEGTEPCSIMAQLGPATNPTPMMHRPLPAASPVPNGPQLMFGREQYNIDDYMIVEGMDSVAMNHLVNPPCMPQSPMPNPRDQLTNLSSQNLNLYAQSARMKKELTDLQAKISSLNIVAENSNTAKERDRLAMELRMIEQGIKERHQEISANLIHPPSSMPVVPDYGSYTVQGLDNNEESQHGMRGYEDQFKKSSQEHIVDQTYNYW
jgi:hypothetical protein